MPLVEPGESDAFDLDVAAATLRANNKDVGTMLSSLAEMLGDALGDRLVVERPRSLLGKPKPIQALQVKLGDDDLRAEVDGATVRCTIGHSSGGIRIRSAQVGMDEWVRRLLGGLEAEAGHSETARLALEHIVLGGPS
jgi:hypothetical protein